MPQRYCYTGNSDSNLLICTPAPSLTTDGYYLLSSELDHSEISIGFRFRLSGVGGATSSMVQIVDSTNTKTSYFEIYEVGEDLVFSTSADGGLILFENLVADEWYSVWIDAGEDSISSYLYRYSTGVTSTSTVAKTYYNCANSLMVVCNQYSTGVTLRGTMCDLTIIPGMYAGCHKVFLYSGVIYYGAYYWPMREGSGSTCRCVRSPSVNLQSGGTFTAPAWSGTLGTDTGRRWI